MQISQVTVTFLFQVVVCTWFAFDAAFIGVGYARLSGLGTAWEPIGLGSGLQDFFSIQHKVPYQVGILFRITLSFDLELFWKCGYFAYSSLYKQYTPCND